MVNLANGVCSLRSTRNGQTFHPVVGPVAEAKAVHLAGTRLVERAEAVESGDFVVWDVGLGAAANAVAAIAELQRVDFKGGGVRLLSFDRTLGALDFALLNADALDYPRAYRTELRALREDGTARIPLAAGRAELSWRLYLGDFPALLASPAPLPPPHAVFFDPYSPVVNPEMWTLDLFSALHARLNAGTPCLLTTYTRSTAVRVTLLLAGFYVGLGPATGEKNQTTVAVNASGLLDRPLGRAWLEQKVLASTNAAPLRASATPPMPAPISQADYARLRLHPQFAAGL